jgi:hypothetical protein
MAPECSQESQPMTLVFAALFALALTGVLIMVLERPRPRAGAFGLDALRAALAPVGVEAKDILLRPDALRIEARGRRCDAFDLVVVTLARDADGKPYPDGTGAAVATEERRFRLAALEVAR